VSIVLEKCRGIKELKELVLKLKIMNKNELYCVKFSIIWSIFLTGFTRQKV
jgi:hypothetical protein